MTYKRVEHIAAGHFKAERNVNDIFQAYLGTCVGVALYDPKTKVGGLIHILLPEPPSFSSTLFQEKYATTGIPMFVRKLIELGADPASLEASIAGGALVGPVSQRI